MWKAKQKVPPKSRYRDLSREEKQFLASMELEIVKGELDSKN